MTTKPFKSSHSPRRGRGIREILLAGVFWRILVIELILLVWSVAYKMITENPGTVALLWYSLRIILLIGVILVFMMVTLRQFLEKKIIRPMEAIADANRRLDVDDPQIENLPLEADTAVEIREVVSTRKRMLEAILKVSDQRLQLVNFIKETFGRYLGHTVVNEILESPQGRKIGGRRQVVTVLMSDLRGFTDLSDARDPENMVQILNRYLEAMTQVIEGYGGVIDEFIGDAILTVFGIPEEKKDDPERAVACALAMQKQLADLNRGFKAEGLPLLEMGVGINTGPVVVGNLGSEARTKYGIVGSAVNIASRIESNTIGGQVLIGEDTYTNIKDLVTVQSPMAVAMKGLKRPIVCYPVTAVGHPFDIRVDSKTIQPVVEFQLPFELRRLEGKKVVANPIRGETKKLNGETFWIEASEDIPVLTDVKLSILFCKDAHCFSDIYAKVIEAKEMASSHRLKLHVTYMEQADRALLDRWIRSV
jgi:adenylate cyclase